jgi:hypothetical protein
MTLYGSGHGECRELSRREAVGVAVHVHVVGPGYGDSQRTRCDTKKRHVRSPEIGAPRVVVDREHLTIAGPPDRGAGPRDLLTVLKPGRRAAVGATPEMDRREAGARDARVVVGVVAHAVHHHWISATTRRGRYRERPCIYERRTGVCRRTPTTPDIGHAFVVPGRADGLTALDDGGLALGEPARHQGGVVVGSVDADVGEPGAGGTSGHEKGEHEPGPHQRGRARQRPTKTARRARQEANSPRMAPARLSSRFPRSRRSVPRRCRTPGPEWCGLSSPTRRGPRSGVRRWSAGQALPP